MLKDFSDMGWGFGHGFMLLAQCFVFLRSQFSPAATICQRS
jgi:hypothetical protein